MPLTRLLSLFIVKPARSNLGHFFSHKALVWVCCVLGMTVLHAPLYAINKKTAATAKKPTPNAARADDIFLDLYEAAKKNQVIDIDRLAHALPKDYPLYAFGQYWRLKAHQVAPNEPAFKQFLSDYEGSFVADRLRNDGLLMLGKAQDWKAFDVALPAFLLKDDAQVDCYAIASKAAQGAAVKVLARDALLRNASTANGTGCSTLLEVMKTTQEWRSEDTSDVEWVRSEARRGGPNLPAARTPTHRAVQWASSCAQRLGNDCAQAFFLHGAGGEKLIDLPDQLQGTGSDTALEWAIRGALRSQNWRVVQALTQRLPAHLAADPTWIYWQARALDAQKQSLAAKPLYEKIAYGWGFYNLLAKETIGQTILLPPAIAPQDTDVRAVMARPEVLRMQTFYRLGLRWEGNREWNWMLRGLTDAQLSAHAEAGRRLGHYDRMVNSAERSKTHIDFSQRFPMPFFKEAQPIATRLKLDLNWVYGLIRQESRFIVEVRSHVGAQGLMQIMPKTAAWVAKKTNLQDWDPTRVQEPETNLALGQAYLAMVLADLDDLPILATAAYNAGPGRPKAWRASLQSPVEGAIFAETIPFNETRGYVKNVLANAALYGATTGQAPRSLKSWLGSVAPKTAINSDLP